MAEDSPEKKAKRDRDKLKQQTVRKLVKNMRDLEASLDDKDIATIHLNMVSLLSLTNTCSQLSLESIGT